MLSKRSNSGGGVGAKVVQALFLVLIVAGGTAAIMCLYFMIDLAVSPNVEQEYLTHVVGLETSSVISCIEGLVGEGNTRVLCLTVFASLKIVGVTIVALAFLGKVRSIVDKVFEEDRSKAAESSVREGALTISDEIAKLAQQFGDPESSISSGVKAVGRAPQSAKHDGSQRGLGAIASAAKGYWDADRLQSGKYLIGIDVGGTRAKLGVVNRFGRCVASQQVEFKKLFGKKRSKTAHCLDELLKTACLSKNNIAAVGIAWPGPVTNGELTRKAVNIDIELDSFINAIDEYFPGVPTCVLNDANAAALGEFSRSGLENDASLALITLGTGVGCGLVVYGTPWEGASGCAGEMGHIASGKQERRKCGCGKTDCMEKYLSSGGLAKTYCSMATADMPTSGIEDAEAVCRLARDTNSSGCGKAAEALDQYAELLGILLAQLANTVDPGNIFISGGVSRSADLFLKETRESFDKHVKPGLECTRINVGKLGDNAGIIGAAAHAVRMFGD